MQLNLSIFFFLALAPSACFSICQPETFASHYNRVFVETGSYLGEGIDKALDAGFEVIHSIELSPKYCQHCRWKFRKNFNVQVHFGDSGNILYDVIKNIQEPITFWLDGHCSFGDTAKGEEMSPILKELEQIKRHPINTHTLLIDDVRGLGTQEFDFITLDQVIEKIHEINPKYEISFEQGLIENDILVAEIKK